MERKIKRGPEEKTVSQFQTVRSTSLVFKMFECECDEKWCENKFDSQEERDFHQAHTCYFGPVSKYWCKIENCDCVQVLQKMDISREKKTIKFVCECGNNHESMQERDFHEGHCCGLTLYCSWACIPFIETGNCSCLEELSREGCDPVIFERLEKSLRAERLSKQKSNEEFVSQKN